MEEGGLIAIMKAQDASSRIVYGSLNIRPQCVQCNRALYKEGINLVS